MSTFFIIFSYLVMIGLVTTLIALAGSLIDKKLLENQVENYGTWSTVINAVTATLIFAWIISAVFALIIGSS